MFITLPKPIILNKVYDNNSIDNIFKFLNEDKPKLYHHIAI